MQDQPIDGVAFEKFPGDGQPSPERIEEAERWEDSMNDAPAFAGEKNDENTVENAA